MNPEKKITTIAGVLYFAGTIAGVLSVAPAIDSPGYLIEAHANSDQVRFSALSQFIMTIAYLGVAILLYTVLRKHKESLALGFLSFRIIAAVLNVIGLIILLSVLALSQDFVKAGGQDQSFFQHTGSLLKTSRVLVNHVAMILTVSVGGLMFYLLLYQSKLVPRWLSCWVVSRYFINHFGKCTGFVQYGQYSHSNLFYAESSIDSA